MGREMIFERELDELPVIEKEREHEQVEIEPVSCGMGGGQIRDAPISVIGTWPAQLPSAMTASSACA
ncbi:hypothetical protein ACQEPB_15175 [Novosphingobium fluoreni]|uniref:hypothetical protein n=1 Tax=Novosphingobium fluoreni TaxID=1391222 RepID=UPI0007363E1E